MHIKASKETIRPGQ